MREVLLGSVLLPVIEEFQSCRTPFRPLMNSFRSCRTQSRHCQAEFWLCRTTFPPSTDQKHEVCRLTRDELRRVYLPKKDRSADVRTGYFCLGSGKTWVVRGPNTGGVALFHGWRSCFEGPRHCFGFLESLAEVMVRFWPFRELCRGSWTRFWPSRGLCRGPVDRFLSPEDGFPLPGDLWD